MALPLALNAIYGYNLRVLKPYINKKGVHIAVNRIREIRKSKGVTQSSLAVLAKVSQPYLHDLELNRRGAKPETIMRIADALGVTVDELTKEAGVSA